MHACCELKNVPALPVLQLPWRACLSSRPRGGVCGLWKGSWRQLVQNPYSKRLMNLNEMNQKFSQ